MFRDLLHGGFPQNCDGRHNPVTGPCDCTVNGIKAEKPGPAAEPGKNGTE